MLFNSLQFFVFLPVVVAVYLAMRAALWRKMWLLVASYAFYMVFSIPLVGLLIASSCIDYGVARRLDASASPGARRRWLFASLASNLGLLFTFKYFNFFAWSLASVVGVDGQTWTLSSLVLPMGISFYTFQTLSYTIDVYRRSIPASRSLLDVALFVAFFPQLVAGPIVRGRDFMPQIAAVPRQGPAPSERLRSGALLVMWGLLKKSLIADPMGRIADQVYGPAVAPWADVAQGGAVTEASVHSGAAVVLATYAFAIQIYCDFSGYSDIAIGSARMFGFRLPQNFNAPYLARSFQEFWRRWHISLSSWLRDYVYIPLGGNRSGRIRTTIHLSLTMLLGGLWHGANWTFVVWGALHALYLGVERALAGRHEARTALGRALRALLVFHFVCLAWIFFRAASIEQAIDLLGAVVTLREGAGGAWRVIPVLAVLGIYQGVVKPRGTVIALLGRIPWIARWSCYLAVAVLTMLYAGSPPSDFIYFQF